MSKLTQLKAIIPKLAPQLHKGQCGRLAVIGGCQDYTGAPYFSAIASMALGCDLVHVITTRDAAGIIKGYSPDLMVHPYLEEEGEGSRDSQMGKCFDVLKRMDAVVIGPGMGRDSKLRDDINEILEYLLGVNKSVILDADALFHLSTNAKMKSIVKSSDSTVILTPNVVEFQRLAQSEGVETIDELARALKCTVIQKGSTDMISVGGVGTITEVDEPGSLKRVGGQGDTLTGVLGTLLCWSVNYKGELSRDEVISTVCFGGCYLTRRACKITFDKYGRGMLTSSIHLSINEAYVEFYGDGV